MIQFIPQTAMEEEQKRKKTKEEKLLLQNYILLFFRKYMYESRATEIMIINVFILKPVSI